MGVKPRRTQAERSATTQGALVRAARELFARDGYAATGREAIVEKAGVTRGALYHHFTDKEGLFRAVVAELEAEVMSQIAEAAMKGDNVLEKLRLGTLAYLDAALDPAVQRICLLDAPAVLPPEVRYEIMEAHALGMVREVLSWAMESGEIRKQPLEPLTHVLLAAIHEAALYVARSPDHAAARAEVGVTVEQMLDGLRDGAG
jgi:AcrR family transcriptional regulator